MFPNQTSFKITAIVEGHGEQLAVPVLLYKWFAQRQLYNFRTDQLAVRASGKGALKRPHDNANELGIEHYIEIALRNRPDGILVLLDADKDCTAAGHPKLGPILKDRAKKVAAHLPISVVVANRTYESWFLAHFEDLQAAGYVSNETAPPLDLTELELYGGHKERLGELVREGYEPTIHQVRFTRCMSFAQPALERSRSLRKLAKELEWLCNQIQ